MSLLDRVPKLYCPTGQQNDHPPLMPGYNFETEEIFMWCFFCDYEQTVGLQSYQRQKYIVERLDSALN